MSGVSSTESSWIYRCLSHTLVTGSPDGRGRSLNLALVNAGFAPDTLTPAVQDLEQVFLRPLVNVDGNHTLLVTLVYSLIFAIIAIVLTWRRDVKE